MQIILKADTQGSVEAISEAIRKLPTDESVRIQIIGSQVGGINESDVNLAVASEALIYGFNVRADAKAKKAAEHLGSPIIYFSIIYDILNDIKMRTQGLVGPKFEEKFIGRAEIKQLFRVSKFGNIAGCMVVEGQLVKDCTARVIRNQKVIYEGVLDSLYRHHDEVKEVQSGTECGAGFSQYQDIKIGDVIETFKRIEVPHPA